eukprot:TRINITY_DN42099_c0_g1_i1.p1 TRINITY_DN42099_c0_g1~~TRINITY_DN42099_c0_g1_i1.p1  ORF type:complete len:328 (-),score=53.66 TRINITY_DN42099_c0_g1_i1:17-1000(-)
MPSGAVGTSHTTWLTGAGSKALIQEFLRSKMNQGQHAATEPSSLSQDSKEKQQALLTERVRARMEERYWAMLRGYLARAETLLPAAELNCDDRPWLSLTAEYFFQDDGDNLSATRCQPAESGNSDSIPAISVFRIDSAFVRSYLQTFDDIDRDKPRVNSMDVQSYQVKLTPILYALLAKVLQCLGVSDGIWRHSASDRQAKAGLDEHRDDSLYTVNISRQAATKGGELVFPQIRSTATPPMPHKSGFTAGYGGPTGGGATSSPDTAARTDAMKDAADSQRHDQEIVGFEPLVHKQEPFTVLVHKGWVRHQVLPITEGCKKNIIVWLS